MANLILKSSWEGLAIKGVQNLCSGPLQSMAIVFMFGLYSSGRVVADLGGSVGSEKGLR